MNRITLTVNGVRHFVDVEDETLLLDVLRETVGTTSVREGCGVGACGACTVLSGGTSVSSCLALAVRYDGAEITTAEGLRRERRRRVVLRGLRRGAVRLLHPRLRADVPRAARREPAPDRAGDHRPPGGQHLPLRHVSRDPPRGGHGRRAEVAAMTTVLLLHSLAMSGELWQPLTERLRAACPGGRDGRPRPRRVHMGRFAVHGRGPRRRRGGPARRPRRRPGGGRRHVDGRLRRGRARRHPAGPRRPAGARGHDRRLRPGQGGGLGRRGRTTRSPSRAPSSWSSSWTAGSHPASPSASPPR